MKTFTHADTSDNVTYTAEMQGAWQEANVKTIGWYYDFNSDSQVDACLLITKTSSGDPPLEGTIYGDSCGQFIGGTASSVTKSGNTLTVVLPLQNVRDVGLGTGSSYKYQVKTKDSTQTAQADPADSAPDGGMTAVHTLGGSSATPTPTPAATASPTPSGSATPTPAPTGSASPTTSPTSTPPLSAQGTLTVDKTTVGTGETVTVSGSGFAPNDEIEIYIRSEPILLGYTTTTAAGTFSKSVVIPSGLSAGTHTLVAIGLDPDDDIRMVAANIQIRAAGLPQTGDDPSPTTIAGLVAMSLVIGGAVAGGVRRTRRAA